MTARAALLFYGREKGHWHTEDNLINAVTEIPRLKIILAAAPNYRQFLHVPLIAVLPAETSRFAEPRASGVI